MAAIVLERLFAEKSLVASAGIVDKADIALRQNRIVTRGLTNVGNNLFQIYRN